MYVDNWYTSVPLLLELERRGILASGTIRANRKYLPQDIVDPKKEQVKRLARGESLFRQSGSLVCVTWTDQKNVHLVSFKESLRGKLFDILETVDSYVEVETIIDQLKN